MEVLATMLQAAGGICIVLAVIGFGVVKFGPKRALLPPAKAPTPPADPAPVTLRTGRHPRPPGPFVGLMALALGCTEACTEGELTRVKDAKSAADRLCVAVESYDADAGFVLRIVAPDGYLIAPMDGGSP